MDCALCLSYLRSVVIKEREENLPLGNTHFYRSYSSKQKSVSRVVMMVMCCFFFFNSLKSSSLLNPLRRILCQSPSKFLMVSYSACVALRTWQFPGLGLCPFLLGGSYFTFSLLGVLTLAVGPGSLRAQDCSGQAEWLFSACNTATLPSSHCRAGLS